MLESHQHEVCDLYGVTFFENTPYFSASLGSTTLLTTHVTLFVPLKDSPPLQVYQRRKKITTEDPNSLPLTSTEVSELHIAPQKGICYCIQHLIAKVLSLSHLSPIYFSFATTLSFMSLPKSYRNAIFCMKKCYG